MVGHRRQLCQTKWMGLATVNIRNPLTLIKRKKPLIELATLMPCMKQGCRFIELLVVTAELKEHRKKSTFLIFYYHICDLCLTGDLLIRAAYLNDDTKNLSMALTHSIGCLSTRKVDTDASQMT